ncbi:glycosyltransferase [Methanoculleus bourgensis MS2]|jgi:glycosyltransferase involved in cell wall biosynthesis|uniref:Glycosyltransferase n=1 Tax=Methanoculleus bourgensis (strain ATCC 43281 / DSM 3045 / OCM 15 / MS2) TaxID=1201294 RepID=I7LK86_METBM|nr:glycosyltransferase family 4 protein [Methanoculleus bourgensis]CCJ36732.1 glycosyltransferase [Methanoculleus bourgensis MS2]
MRSQRDLVLITGRWRKDSSLYPAEKLITILKAYADSITWIATKEGGLDYHDDCVHLIEVPDRLVEEPFYLNLFYHILHQLRVLSLLVRTRGDTVVFAFGSDLCLLPIIFGRLAGKEVILRSDGRPSKVYGMGKDQAAPIIERMFWLIERITYATASRLVPESPVMVSRYHLERYQHKIETGGLYVDTGLFISIKEVEKRRFRVGYVGRLSEEKGVLAFAESLSTILSDPGEEAMIIGYGHLAPVVARILSDGGIQHQVLCTGRIENRDLPRYLNEIQMVVLPSAFEGLPNVVLEAMACGCAVLATPVGGIPDLVHDGVTGFLLDDQSPEAIARGISRAYSHYDLAGITENARHLIEQQYTFPAAVERYGRVLGIPHPAK